MRTILDEIFVNKEESRMSITKAILISLPISIPLAILVIFLLEKFLPIIGSIV